MSKFDLETFNELIKNFYKIKKRILQNRPISTKVTKVNEYIELLIENYNCIISYTRLHSYEPSSATKDIIYDKISHCRELLVRCFGKLDCKIRVSHEISLFELVDREILTETDSDSENSEFGNESDSNEKEQMLKIKSDNTINIDPKVEFRPEMVSIDQKKSFIGMCATILRENYDGNPLSLQSFLDKIDLIEDLTDTNLTVTLISFIKSKLEGKAREALPDKVNTIVEIKNALKIKKIKIIT